ncbi:MAG: hypothetical protein QOE08_18, partial [Thermoleophilaceae bacterium]|nr:hypothetical protein [Thermoleophilaceae bacterium]
MAGVAAVLGALAVAAPAQAAAPRVWTDGFDAAPRAWKAAGPKAVLVHSTL